MCAKQFQVALPRECAVRDGYGDDGQQIVDRIRGWKFLLPQEEKGGVCLHENYAIETGQKRGLIILNSEYAEVLDMVKTNRNKLSLIFNSQLTRGKF